MERSIRGRPKTLMPAAQGLALGGQGDVAPFKPARPSPLWVVPEQVFLLVHAQSPATRATYVWATRRTLG